MPRRKASRKYLLLAVISFLDDAIIITLLVLLLSHFIQVPLWLLIPVGLISVGWTVVSIAVIRKNPQLGFENRVGATGVTVGALSPKGTVRIGHELWAATADHRHIEAGATILVVGQNGLLLTVVKKDEKSNAETGLRAVQTWEGKGWGGAP